ncbi:MAG: RNA methyltransferase [Magnetococcales bacterium]|nr:RNA methyltransferase [Magnetococcales bacterium]NGZ06199.1 RNA methyltransferase [Magnetococcales bacterium]
MVESHSIQAAERLVVILDRPAHPGNIGAVARAMGNTGFSRLRLVAPRQFPHPDADNYAVGCTAILEQTAIYADLTAALADCHLVVATTNRARGQRQVVLTPDQLGERVRTFLTRPEVQVGILFGTERTGLLSADVERAGLICHIPTRGEQGSLNLSQAVLLVLYALMQALGKEEGMAHDPFRDDPPATAEAMEHLFVHMEETLTAIGFLKPGQKRHMMGSIKAIFHRAGLDRREVSILRGILHEVISCRDRP